MQGTVSLRSVHGKFLSAQPDGRAEWNRDVALDWKLPRHVRARGVTSVATADLNIITCKNCGFTELYELTEEELAPVNKKARMIFIFAGVLPTLLGIAIPIWLIWG